ncbi:hypothetical protein K8352_06490 [Flavobacteriaceae bacterium F89]|uniref:Uncharacterized protein n=1 Tax=Cerina litoralis TaxID=2874477 RepID=A0AAE3EUI7_9FLAO|nr:hypothetical protein [Cerina litoralis]MCG2460389.1 hypothetical protein [Cerina litoralis]
MKRVLEQKFNTIGFLDSDELIKELQNYNTISDKLDYLKSIKERYYDKFQSVIEGFSKEERIYYYTDNNRTQFWQSVFGNCSPITPLSIQQPVFDRYFKNEQNNPEFTYWFLKYNSEQAFNLHINNEEFRNKINSDLKATFIEAELKQLNDFEAKAKKLLLNNELDIYRPHPNNNKYAKEVVLLRVLDGNYYKKNTLTTISNFGDEVQAYYKYKLLKAYLVSELNELPPQPNTEQKPESTNVNVFCRTMSIIIPKEHFKPFTTAKSKLNNMPFLSIKQFNDFIDRAFLGNADINKVKFNMKPKGEISKIQYVFREFYEKYAHEYGLYQEDFIKLLTDNFIGWEYSKVKNNFKNKPKQTI